MAEGGPPLPKPTTFENYQCERNRIRSFVGWPLNDTIKPELLAQVGFVYTGEGTLVKCFCCGAKYRDWHKGDNPVIVHQKCNRSCSFLQTLTCKQKQPKSRSSEPNNYGNHVQSCHHTMADCDGVLSNSLGTNHDPQSPCGGGNLDRTFLPITPANYHCKRKRIRSFDGWSSAVHPVKLACAGFVYTGKGTLVQCFQCGVKYRCWNQGDNPYDIHYKCNPRCPFLQTLMVRHGFTRNKSIPLHSSAVPSICEPQICTEQPATSGQVADALPAVRYKQQDKFNMPIEAEREKITSLFPTSTYPYQPQCHHPTMTVRHQYLPNHPGIAAFVDDNSLPHHTPQQYCEQSEFEDRGGINPFTSDMHLGVDQEQQQQIPAERQPPVLRMEQREAVKSLDILKSLDDTLKSQAVVLDDSSWMVRG